MSIRILLSRIAIVFSLVCVTACGRFDKTLDDNVDPDILSHLFEKKDEKIKVVDVEFAPDYKTFTVSTDVEHDVGYHELKIQPKSVWRSRKPLKVLEWPDSQPLV